MAWIGSLACSPNDKVLALAARGAITPRVPTATMSRRAAWRKRVLWLSFIESFATILIERAIYFFSHERLGYSPAQNLALALVFGVTYTGGAASSHFLARRLGDRPALGAALVVLFALHGLMALSPSGMALTLAFAAVGFVEGAKWPIIESYVGAGLEPREQLGAVGRFNVSWALAVPLALAVAGPIIASSWPAFLFVLAALINLLALGLLATLPSAAPHLEATHPARLEAAPLGKYEALLASSRWTMLSSYTLMFLLAPLLPVVFARLGRPVAEATLWVSCMDGVRVLTFASLAIYSGWHGRSWPLVVAAIGLPLGGAAIIGGTSLAWVLAGEVVFGVLAGVTYHAALYYAMVVKNAAVDAGGGHEGLIGIGLTLGPGVGLLGDFMARDAAGPWIALAVAPIVLASWYGSLRALARARVGALS
jgi:MFS family permease